MVSGCANQPQRRFGWCAVGGGLIGLAAGESVGWVTTHRGDNEEVTIGTTTGIAGGLVLGAIAGHYICDPVVQPPPPPPTSP